MKKTCLLLLMILSLNVFAQKQDSTKTVEFKYSPGHYFKLAGNDLLYGIACEFVSAVCLVLYNNVTYDPYNKGGKTQGEALLLVGVAGGIFSIIEFTSAGINYHEAGKRMIELKMGVMSNSHIGFTLTF